MARSTYIYLAIDEGMPLAAFTVKYELQDWFDKQTDDALQTIYIYRMRDGEGGEVKDITHEFFE